MSSTLDGKLLPYKESFYDEDFFTGKSGEKGRNRLVDSGIYYGHALALQAMFGTVDRALSVADGVGHASKHLVHLGWGRVVHTDISQFALENSAFKQCGCEKCRARSSSVRADVRDLSPFTDGFYDVVWCINLLGYLPKKDWKLAVEQMARKVIKGGCLALQTNTVEEFSDVRYAINGRPHYRTDERWEKLFYSIGWVQDYEAIERARAAGHHWPWALRRV